MFRLGSVRLPCAGRGCDRYPDAGMRIRFTSSILPPYLRSAKSVEELLPWLYLKGISTGDLGKALGPDTRTSMPAEPDQEHENKEMATV